MEYPYHMTAFFSRIFYVQFFLFMTINTSCCPLLYLRGLEDKIEKPVFLVLSYLSSFLR